MIIETQIHRSYHCRIYITTDERRENLLFNKGFSLAFKHNVDLETFQGCPAAGPYMEASSESVTKMTAWSRGIKSYLRKFKNVTYR